MLFGVEERKYYRFPSQSSILDYEMDHDVYCPAKDAIHYNEHVPSGKTIIREHSRENTYNTLH